VFATLCSIIYAQPTSKYFIGQRGPSCAETCYSMGLNCNPHIVTNNSSAIFNQLGINCKANPTNWWAEDQPSYVSGQNDPNYGECLGFTNVPGGVLCGGSFPTTQRLCRCDEPSSSVATFGTGLSNGMVTTTEQWVFQWFVAPGDTGVMTHFWVTYGTSVDDGVVVRYYIDGEDEASIQFTPSLACGVGSYDNQGPWGTKWFGKGAQDGAWFLNFRIPFHKSVAVTVQHQFADFPGFYMIVRGGLNVPIVVGGVNVPLDTARMWLFTTNTTFQPLDWVTLAALPAGTQGLHFMHSISVSSGNMNFLEGCYHMFSPPAQEFPGTVLSTGTEDYFDSAWYFNGGEFHLPVSGFTHLAGGDNGTPITWSAYRFHEMDPLQFNNGFELVWRNGDALDATGVKCMMNQGGTTVGSPTASNVTAYAWVYTWEANV